MFFSGLKYDYTAWEAGDLDRIENKQRINLSDRAYAALIYDMDVFRAQQESDKEPCEGHMSRIVNRIFRSFAESAQSSVVQTLSRMHSRYSEVLSTLPSVTREDAMKLLMHEHRNSLAIASEQRCKEKGHPITVRLDKWALAYLVSDEGQAEACYYHDNIGLYLKALLEEYALNSYVMREQIYHREILDEIELAISRKRC